MYKEKYKTNDGNFTSGIITVNNSTAKDFASILQQGRTVSHVEINTIARSIEDYGSFKLSKPIIINSDSGLTVDGYTRSKAVLLLIKEGAFDEIDVSFVMTKDAMSQDFNQGRGLAAEDLYGLFRRKGVVSGSADRALEQCLEASKMIDVAKVGFTKAFSTTRDQQHFARIDTNRQVFSDAFDGVVELANGDSPNNFKFSHWIAFFARNGVSNLTKNIAKKSMVSNIGTNQVDRFAAFEALESAFNRSREI